MRAPPFSISRAGPNRIDMELAGTLDAAATERFLDKWRAVAADMDRPRILYRVKAKMRPNWGSMQVMRRRWDETNALFFGADRWAVVSDSWLVRKLFSFKVEGVTCRTWKLQDAHLARAWPDEP